MTNELKEKLLAYGTKAEPFTVHNHIRVTDLQDGEARVAEAERLAHAIHVAHGDEGAAQPRRIQKVDGGVDGEAHFLPQGQDRRSGGDVR